MNYEDYIKTIPLENPSIISISRGDINGDFIFDTIYLVGNKEINSPFIENITIIIEDGKSKDFYHITPKNNTGYNPNLSLVRFSQNDYKDILLSIESGGSGGIGFYYVYNFFKNNPSLLFDFEEFNNRYQYEINYLDNYKVEIKNLTLRNKFIIDISYRPKEYLDDIYDNNGNLKEPIKGFISGLSALYPVDFDNDNVFNLIGLQRISGLYAADGIGYIQTELTMTHGGFYPLNNNQSFLILSTKF